MTTSLAPATRMPSSLSLHLHKPSGCFVLLDYIKGYTKKFLTLISPVDNIRLFRGRPGGRLLAGGNILTASSSPSIVRPVAMTSAVMGNILPEYAEDRVSTE